MKRAPNFSTEEVHLLLQILEAKRSIVDCKKTDKLSTDRKEKAWKLIAAEFNAKSVSAPFRNVYTLKKKHENLKKVLKRSLPGESRGPHDDSVKYSTKLSSHISEQKAHKAGHGHHNDLLHNPSPDLTEADNIFKEETTIPSAAPPSVESTLLIEGQLILPDEEATVCRSKHDLTQSQILVENGGNSKFSWANVACKKAKWAEEKLKTEIDILKKEHQQRMQFMQEKHDIEMRILRNELAKSELYLDSSI